MLMHLKSHKAHQANQVLQSQIYICMNYSTCSCYYYTQKESQQWEDEWAVSEPHAVAATPTARVQRRVHRGEGCHGLQGGVVGWRGLGAGCGMGLAWCHRGRGVSARGAARGWLAGCGACRAPCRWQGQWRVGLRHGGKLVAVGWWRVHGGDCKTYH